MSVSVGYCFAVASLLNLCSADTPKAAKATEEVKTTRMINWANLDVVDYLRSGALLVAFLAILLSDKRGKSNVRARKTNNWVNAEVVAFFVTGLACYFFPVNFFQYFNNGGKVSIATQIEFQNLGAILIPFAITTARIQTSIESDGTVYGGWITSRLLGSATLFVFLVCSRDMFNDQFLTFAAFGSLLWFIGNQYQVCRGAPVGVSGTSRGSTSDGVNFYLLLDVLFCLPFTLTVLAMPHRFTELFTTLKDLDPQADFVSRVEGIFIVFFAVQMIGALYCDEESVKKEFLFGRIVFMALNLPLLGLHQWKSAILTPNGLAVTLGMSGVLMACALRGYLYKDEKVKTR